MSASAKALSSGFVYQGDVSHYRHDEVRGEPSGHLPPTAFVAFMQNHDQIGNRAFGERIADLAEFEAVKAMQAVLLLAPNVPLLFMGEEWGATQPFCFFTDFHDELADAVREGRRREFSKFPEFASEAARAHIPDPNALSTFAASRLDWSVPEQPEHAAWLDYVRGLLRLRHETIVPRLAGDRRRHRREHADRRAGTAGRLDARRRCPPCPGRQPRRRAAGGFRRAAGRADLRESGRIAGGAGRGPPARVVGRLVPGAPELMGACGGERPLARLARLYDIEPGYEDAFGAWQTVGDDTLRALLAVMGCRPAAGGRSRPDCARPRSGRGAGWSAPVGTLTEGQAPVVELNLPGAEGSARLEWRLTEACGTVRRGSGAARASAGDREPSARRRALPALPLAAASRAARRASTASSCARRRPGGGRARRRAR